MKLRLLLAVAFLAAFAFGQSADVPRAEVFGGFSYLHFSPPGNGFGAVGFGGALDVNLTPLFGVEADMSGHWHGNCEEVLGATCKDFSYSFGPRFTERSDKVSVFEHVLFGGDSGTVEYQACSSCATFAVSDAPYLFNIGGGVDWQATQHFGIRLFELDYGRAHHLAAYTSQSDTLVRIQAGVVFHFGKLP